MQPLVIRMRERRPRERARSLHRRGACARRSTRRLRRRAGRSRHSRTAATRSDAEDRAGRSILLATGVGSVALGEEPARRSQPPVAAVELGSSASTVTSSTCRPERAHRAIDAPSERTPSSECGERTTIRLTALSSRPWQPANRTARPPAGGDSFRQGAKTAASSARRLRRLAPTPAARPRRPSPGHARRRELGLRARDADRPRLRRALRRLARRRHPRPRARDRGSGLHEPLRDRRDRGRHPHGRRTAIRRRRSSATSPTLRRSRTTSFDCAIVTQTLQFVYDVRSALATLHRILAPGGVLLATVPGLTRISPLEDEAVRRVVALHGRSLRRLAEEAFGEENVEVASYGNVLAATGFLYGLAASDLRAGGARRTRSALRGRRRPAGRQARLSSALRRSASLR